MTNFLQSKCAWVNQQHKLTLAANRWALKRIKHTAEKSVSQTGGKALYIPLGNLVLLHDYLEGHNKIQDNYKSKLFVVELKPKDPNVYTIKPLNGKDPMHVQSIDVSYLTFISHMGMICHLIQSLIPIYLLHWLRKPLKK